MENIPGQMPGGVGKSGGIDPLVEDLAYRKFEEELVDTVIAALSRHCMEREDVSYLTGTMDPGLTNLDYGTASTLSV